MLRKTHIYQRMTEKPSGLTKVLKLCKNACVILLGNICTEYGLCNDPEGNVIGIDFHKNSEMPVLIYVKFVDPTYFVFKMVWHNVALSRVKTLPG